MDKCTVLTSHFVNLLKISNYVPKARARYSSLLTKCIANMLELHLFFASFPFCCIRMKLLTSRPRPPPPPKCHYDVKRTNHNLEMPPKLVPHTAIMIYIYISGGGAATFSDVLRCNWCRVIDSIDDATAFANQLKQAGFISRPVYNTAIAGRLGQTTKDRVTNLLASTEGAIKNRDEQHFVKLCEIVREGR